MTQYYFSPTDSKSQPTATPSNAEPTTSGVLQQHQTLRAEVQCAGIGLHNGQNVTVRLMPSQTPGLIFARTDLPNHPEIGASLSHVASTTHATTLQREGVSVGTTEHLLAALWAMQVTACRIEIDGAEVPILDGSAREWCHPIDLAGVQPLSKQEARTMWGLRHPVAVVAGESCVLGLPHPQLRISGLVEYATSWPSRQSFDVEISPQRFVDELAAARTFTLQSWIEPLQAAGLIRGGSPDNAIILSEDGPSSPWRMENELVRHKLLDLLGDIALLFGDNPYSGGALQAHLIAVKAGHELHRRWMHECLQQDALIRIA